jgi:O-antigen/teichoic acid export membrane protein
VIWQRLIAWIRRLLRRGPRDTAKRPDGAKAKREKVPPSALSAFGARVGGHARVYGAGNVGSLAAGLLTLAVLTSFLPPTEFGRYALFLILASMFALLYTLPTLRGTYRYVFGAGGDDDEDDEDDEAAEAPRGEKRRALGTAVALTALIAVVGSLAVVLLAPAISAAVLGSAADSSLLRLAAVAGAFWAVWQLTLTIPFRERRPGLYVLLNLARPVLVLAASVPLLAWQATVGAAVLALAVGTALAGLTALVATRGSYRLAFSSDDARGILRLGAPLIPTVLSIWLVTNGSVLVLTGFVSESEVGLFRVAAGVAAIASYPVAAFIRAWGPLRQEPIHGAVQAERGPVAAGGIVGTYFGLAAIGVLLGFATLADVLVRIAPPAYAAASLLIPVLGVGLLAQGAFRVARRTAMFRRKRAAFIQLSVVAAVVFLAVSFALVPVLGTYGAAIAIAAGFGMATAGMLWRSQRGPNPVPYAWRRMLAGLAIAAGCYLAGRALAPQAGVLALLVEVAVLAAYPVLLLATGVVPRAHVAPLRRVLGSVVRRRRPDRDTRVDLGALEPAERALLEVLIRHRQPLERVAAVTDMPPQALARSFVAALRRAAGLRAGSKLDGRAGRYLLAGGPVAERDQLWRRLASEGIDPLELDALAMALERLRRAPERLWSESRPDQQDPPRGPAVPPLAAAR